MRTEAPYIRAATKADHKAILAIAKQSKYTNAYGSMMFSGDAAYADGWIMVAEDPKGDILGFTCTRHYKRKAPKVKLWFITVDKECRSRGTGHALIEHVMRHATHRVMTLDVAKDNDRAKAFYDREGFTVVGESMEDTCWVMEKTWPDRE